MDGFIIANSKWSDEQALAAACHTFGRTMQEAWIRHVGNTGGRDRQAIIHAWAQRGYVPRPCTLSTAKQ